MNEIKFKLNDMVIEKNDDSFGSRADTVIEILDDCYVLQDNYVGMTFKLSFKEAHENWVALPTTKFKTTEEFSIKSLFRILFWSFALSTVVIPIIYYFFL